MTGETEFDARIGTVIQDFDVEVERGLLRLFARAIGETDPIFFDDEAARKAGYRGVVAPPTYLYCLSEDVPDPNAAIHAFGLDPADCVHAEQEIEQLRPICAGDRLHGETRIEDAFEKKGGLLKFVVTATRFTDPAGMLVGRLRTTIIASEAD